MSDVPLFLGVFIVTVCACLVYVIMQMLAQALTGLVSVNFCILFITSHIILLFLQ